MANYTIDISFKCDRCGMVSHYVSDADRVSRASSTRYDIICEETFSEIRQPVYIGPGTVMLCNECKRAYDDLIEISKNMQTTMIDTFLTARKTKSDRED